MTREENVLRLAELCRYPEFSIRGTILVDAWDWHNFVWRATEGDLRQAEKFLADDLLGEREPRGN